MNIALAGRVFTAYLPIETLDTAWSLQLAGLDIPDEEFTNGQSVIQSLLADKPPKCCYRLFSVSESGDSEFSGSDIADHLASCRRGVMFAVTLGAAIDSQIRRAGATSQLAAFYLDCLASGAVEQAANKAEALFREEFKFSHSVSRYSPGYGDFELSYQREFLSLLDSHRSIGVTVTTSGIMTPRKTISAVLGIL
ncbi:MAG: hypothetical protein LBN40_04555 [Oscillospiraceae bacterium]|nr:hypothetical protein [Oscillospiraceae bacterium]